MIKIILWVILLVTLFLSLFILWTLLTAIFRKKDFKHFLEHGMLFVSLIGSMAAVFGVLQFFQDLEIRNRPYVYAEYRITANNDGVFLSETAVKNCGLSPAYDVTCSIQTRINSRDITLPDRESKSFLLYPNGSQYRQYSFDYKPGDKVESCTEIKYSDTLGRKYAYTMNAELWDTGNGNFSWKTTNSSESRE